MGEKERASLVMENLRCNKERKVLVASEEKVMWGLRMMMVVVAAIFLSRLVFLQIVSGGRMSAMAEGNRVEVWKIPAERGVIEDRNGEVLARNGLNDKGEVVREYPDGVNLAHVLGYVGGVDEEEKKELSDGYYDELKLGKAGIEKAMDEKLRGRAGEELVEVDAMGKLVRLIGKKDPIAGEKVKLWIDAGLQKRIGEILSEREVEKGKFGGSVVVSRVSNGEVLGLVSWPSFDVNVFTMNNGGDDEINKLLSDTDWRPMFDRAVGGVYPPGSVYKLVTAVAGIEEGKVDRETMVEDTGEIKVGTYRYGNWYFDQYGKTEGEIDLTQAIARSNDIYFYKVGEWVGVDKLVEWSKNLGLGRKTGIELPGEAEGRIPDPNWKERLTGERWFLGNTYHMSIGQGDLMVSPMQINRMTAAVINGRWCKPRLSEDTMEDCVAVERSVNEKMILEGMIKACSEGGTGFTFFDFEPRVACKTGTAQQGGEKDDPHAWMSVIIPDSEGSYENGVVITVMLEEAGEGSYEAGPVARSVADYIVENGLNK